jgi:LacI family transcriptional regulator/LacI family repressor for deo operon, udp, cdd, tsx, nupC, and nupG
MPTIKDVAELAKVSTATVSYVLNGTGSVTAATRQRVLEAVAQLDYRPNHAARSLRSRSRTLGIVLPTGATGLADPALAELVAGLAEAVAEAGYFLILAAASPERNEATLADELVRSGRVDGLVVLDPVVDDPRVAALAAQHIPLAFVGPVEPNQLSVAAPIDLARGVQSAMHHLISLGHRRIALIALPSDLIESEQTFVAYSAALEAAGCEVDPLLIVEAGTSQDDGMAATQELLALPDAPTAIFAASDALAFGAMHALRDAGLRIGHDVSLIGCGDVPLAAHIHPALTTLRVPRHARGAQLARHMIALLEGRPLPPAASLPLPLMLRHSTGLPAGVIR